MEISPSIDVQTRAATPIRISIYKAPDRSA
jgi:hypothetical protein